MPRKPRSIEQPGEQPSTESNVDEAINAAQSGRARKIEKPKPKVPASPVKGDPERPKDAVVNKRTEMRYDEAMKLMAEGKLKRSVLTEKGWLAVPRAIPAQAKV